MQLSAATLYAAAQQGPRPAPQPAATPAFAPQLSAAQSQDDGFAPLAFKKTAAPMPQPQPVQVQAAPSRPGATLDIKI